MAGDRMGLVALTSAPCVPMLGWSSTLVVTWDQRGTGKSYAALDPVDTLTLEGMMATQSS